LKHFDEPYSMIPCSECSIGMMRKTRATYFTWIGDDLITVPDFPAWVCDICGRREFDVQALNHLELLLSPALSKKVSRSHGKSAGPAESASKGTQPTT